MPYYNTMIDSNSPNSNLLLRGARLIVPSGIGDAKDLLIENGRIARILSSRENFKGSSVNSIDLDGFSLFPGFIDVHIHGAAGVDTMEATTDELHRFADFLAREGVTSWLPTIVPASDEEYRRVAETVDQLIVEQRVRSTGARAIGLHYEGPFVNHAQCGALHTEHFKTYRDEAQLDSLPILKTEGSRMMMTLAPEIERGVDLVRTLHDRDWIISIGHTRALPEVLDRAHQAGAHHMTHFMNAMAPLHQRSPGPVAWGLMRDDVSCDVVADGIHLDPLMLRLLLKVKRPQRLSLISDSIAAAGMGDGEYKIWGETITVSNGRTSNAAGSIAGSVITMLDAVRLMLTLGVSEVEAAGMASSNPARLLRLDNDCGSIEEGKRADLVALDERGRVRLTIIGGHVAFQQ